VFSWKANQLPDKGINFSECEKLDKFSLEYKKACKHFFFHKLGFLWMFYERLILIYRLRFVVPIGEFFDWQLLLKHAI
jgi:hypothetical protein